MSVIIPLADLLARADSAVTPDTQYIWARDPDPAGPFQPGGDCSGFAHWIYAHYGLSWVLPQTELLYFAAKGLGRLRPPQEVQPGWMLMHRTGFLGTGTGHVAMYVGAKDGQPTTVEAHSSHTTPQVGYFPAGILHRWEVAIAVPEVNASLPDIAVFVNACRATTVKQGDTGPVVKFLQQELGIVPQDGAFGPQTWTAVTAFQTWFVGAQKAKGLTDPYLLPINGICDPHTWAALALKDA